MDAVSRPFSQIINGAKQFVIPVFQRDYSWGWEQCLQMWSDIHNSRGEGDNNHFLGSFVYVEGNAGAAFSSWLVIDGQQRITTLTLLMVALRDHVLETQWNGEEPTVGRIDAYFLKNREESGERGYRLALRRRDNETLRALIDGKDVSEIADSSELILDAYTYFRELLRGPGVDPAQIYEGVHRLVVVDVKLQLAVDNPQLIFESLNSTGIDLTQSDLIRNYLLMGLPEEDQTRLYNDYWSRMEATFRHAGGGLDYFLRDYIALKQELTTQPLAEKIYAHFKTFWPQSEVVTTAERLEEVVEFGQYYASFLRPALTRDKELVRPLSNVREGGFGTAHAILVVRLYDLFGRGLLSVGEFSDAMTLIKSYLLRRAVLGLQTRSYWGVFVRMAHSIDEDAPFETFKVALARERGRYQFPSDGSFFSGLRERDLSALRCCRHILDTLENSGQSEQSHVGSYTIEHIMPQIIEGVEEWQTMLGDDWEEVHSTWLHRLGNLTLVGWEKNISYSNRPFDEKKSIPGGFNETAVRLNLYVRDQERWTAHQMEERGNTLARLALAIWPYPQADMSLVRDKEIAELKARSSEKDASSLSMGVATREVLEALQASIGTLGDTIPVIENKSVCYYDGHGAFFAELLPMSGYIRLLIPVAFDEVDDPEGLAGDVTAWKFLPNVVHRECGVYIDVHGIQHVEAAMRMVRQDFPGASD